MRNGVDRPAISTGPALMIPAGYPRDLPSALLRAARDFGTSGVVEIGPDGRETRLDFPTLLELAARILAGLRANGVRAGDPAVVHCTEPVGFFAAFWACTLGGIRPLLMAPAPEGDTTEEGRERLRKVTDLLGWTVLIGRPSDLPNDLGLPVLDPDALAGHEPTSEFHRPAADDVAVLMMTSGTTTGTPKIIQLTHRGLVEFAAGTPAMLPVRPGQTTLNWLPLDQSGAFLLYHLLPVFTGCTNIHVATDWVLANPLRWLDLMDQHRVNHSWSPNFGYRLAAAAIAGEPDRHWDLSALRSLVSGGEQITVPVMSEFLRLTNRFGVVPETFVAAWGMTETVTGITFARPGLTPNVHRVRIPPTGVVEWVDQRTPASGKVAVARPGKPRADAPGVLSLVSVGAPAPGATVRIVGPNGAVLPEGRIGQLQIASARVTPGYLGNPEADRAAFPAGNWPARKWLSTGDQGFISGGQVVITGRDSDRLIVNGQNYYAHDIEAIAATAPGAVAGLVAACGVADLESGTDRLVLFYALDPADSGPVAATTEAIRAAVLDRLGFDAQVIAVPRRHFPTTPGGKILRPLLKQRWLDGALETAPGPYNSPYGEPVRPGATPIPDSFDEDPSERTTELPVIRLAWRRSITDSIPHPPERPTLGANRHPDPLTEAEDPIPVEATSELAEASTSADRPTSADAPTSPDAPTSADAAISPEASASADPLTGDAPAAADEQPLSGGPAEDGPSPAEDAPDGTFFNSSAFSTENPSATIDRPVFSTHPAQLVTPEPAPGEATPDASDVEADKAAAPAADETAAAEAEEDVAPEVAAEAAPASEAERAPSADAEGERAPDAVAEGDEAANSQADASTADVAAVAESAPADAEPDQAAQPDSAEADLAEDSEQPEAAESAAQIHMAVSADTAEAADSPADAPSTDVGEAAEKPARVSGQSEEVAAPEVSATADVDEGTEPPAAGSEAGEDVEPALVDADTDPAEKPSDRADAEQYVGAVDAEKPAETDGAGVVGTEEASAQEVGASAEVPDGVEQAAAATSAESDELAETQPDPAAADASEVVESAAANAEAAESEPSVSAAATPADAAAPAPADAAATAAVADLVEEIEPTADGAGGVADVATADSASASAQVEEVVAPDVEAAADPRGGGVVQPDPEVVPADVRAGEAGLPEVEDAPADAPAGDDAVEAAAVAEGLEQAAGSVGVEQAVGASAEADQVAEVPGGAVEAEAAQADGVGVVGSARAGEGEVAALEVGEAAGAEAVPEDAQAEEQVAESEIAAAAEPKAAEPKVAEGSEQATAAAADVVADVVADVARSGEPALVAEVVEGDGGSGAELRVVEGAGAGAEGASATAQGVQGAEGPGTAGEPAGKGKKKARKAAKGAVAEPVAVVGLAARFPGAGSLEEFWDNLVGGVESLRRFGADEVAGGDQAFGDDELVAVSGALDDVESFDAAFFGLSDREAELTDPAQRLFLEVCQHALEHGGYAGASGRIGVFAGSGMNLYTQQNQPPDSLATRVAYRLGLTGPAIGVQAAWSSSLVAVHLACQALRSGDADLALAGAAAVHVPQATGYHASPGSILSPSGHIRAFDAEADGTVGGNGVAAVLLKRLDQAVADGDTVYAVIKGSAVTNGNAADSEPGQQGQVESIERALEQAGVPAESLSYIEANATGTAADDSAEFRALATALRRHTDKVGYCTIGSVKPNIGHLDSAAGMAGLIKTVLMLQHRTLVPTINYRKPNPALPLAGSPFVIGTEVRDWEAGTPLRAGVSALDAGGTNAHVILEEPPRQIRRGDDGPVVLPISAPEPHALAELAELFRADLEHGTGHRLIDLAGTAAIGRPAHRHRLAVAGSSENELAEALATALAVEVPRGGPGPLGFAFTGQGAARRGMAAGLASRFPVFRQVLDECDKVYEEEFGGRLLELLLTPAGPSEGVWPTETAQPALFAFELALARLWQSFGVQPALVVGHSVGEYAALCVAGALSLADGVRLTAQRGVLMQRGTVPGAMVAVRADADRVRELAKTPGVEIAAGNGPQSFVLTGTEVIVGQLAEQLDRLELKWQRLDVDRAFHSSLVDPILADFAEAVAQIKLKPLRMPMVSSWSGELLESGTALDGDYLVGQLRQPVLFGDAVEALTAAGCRRFLELGPDAVLSPAGRRIAPNSTWIPTQRLGQDPVLATMNGLAELFQQGTEITWARVYPESGRVPLPTYPFRRVHHPVDPASLRPVARTQSPVVEDRPIERSGAALKKIPLDPPASNGVVAPPVEQGEVHDSSPFAIPAEDGTDGRRSPQQAEEMVAAADGPAANGAAGNGIVNGAAGHSVVNGAAGNGVVNGAAGNGVVNGVAGNGIAELLGADYVQMLPPSDRSQVSAAELLAADYVQMLPAAKTQSADDPAVQVSAEALLDVEYVRMVPVAPGTADSALAEVDANLTDGAAEDQAESTVEDAGVPVDAALTAAERYRESLEVVLDLTGEQLGLDPYDLTVDHTFVELGADSLSMLRVVEEVGQRFDVELAVSELFEELNTPHKLASAIASRNVPGGEVDPLDLVRTTTPQKPQPEAEAAEVDAVPDAAPQKVDEPAAAKTERVPAEEVTRDPRAALAVLGSGLAELAAKVDAAAAATSEAELPGSGMAALMSQQLRVAGQLVDGVTKLMHEQLALYNDSKSTAEVSPAAAPAPVAPDAGRDAKPETKRKPATKPTAVQPEPKTAEAQAAEVQAKADAEAKAEAEKAKRGRDLEFWRTVLDSVQPLVLPTDRSRPAANDALASTVHHLDAGLGDAVFAFSRDRRVSPLMTMLAAVGTVLGRFAAQDDITVGTAALRRAGETTSRHALPIRLDLSGEPDLGDLAQRVRETTTAAFDHATVDLAVLEQDPLFRVIVEFEAGDEQLAPGLDLRFRLEHHVDGITCTADYRAGLFDESTIRRFLDYVEAVLRRAIAEPRRSLPELMLPIESDEEALRELEGDAPQPVQTSRVRRNAVVAGELSGLHTLFEQQVARTPDAIALIQGEREITYAELDRRSNAIAWQLVDLGVKPGQLVAVRVARGAELVVGVLAVLKSGAAYLPLDAGEPESRWAFMTADAEALALVGDDAALADRLGLRLVPVAAVDGDPRAKQAPPVRSAAGDIAYCIYTSGATGNPKGVAVPHRGPVNLIRQYLRTRRSLRTLQWTSFGFDVHVQEMFTALASGAALVLIGEDDRYDPDAVVAALVQHQVERLFMAFTPLTALLATMRKLPELPALREIVAGGEAMVLTHKIRDFLAAHPDCTLYNEYGPTEASVVTTIHQVDPAEDRPSIGRPIDGVVVRLLDEALRPVPVGAVGEIHLGGVAVAHGYLGRPDETEAAFVADPAHPGGRLYRSRDLGRWRTDGSLDYLGRADDQVKIRGHRVEPGETEHVLADLPGVIDAVVVACADPAGDTCLLGYVVLEDSDPAVLARLLLELTKELPIYLVPADLIPVEDLPLDPNGKLDRTQLPVPEWLKD
ncbi:amino acid adenylation domain-containing protein [Kribbella qitaiheensis]|uniref:amino acid adenylation domain-containing protein n=1 Tax=Kribbella qitaiheensis TaxID=1544730 RepID=UPI003610829F